MKKNILFFSVMLALMATACTLGSGSTAQPEAGTPQANTSQPSSTQPGTTLPSDPVSINEGLSSLNSYHMTVSIKSTGPDLSESSTLVVVTEHSTDQNADHNLISQLSIPKDGGDPSSSDTEIYRIGYDQCTGSDGEWSWSSMAPNEKEMMDLTTDMLGFTPLIDNPTYVGMETMNGIASNHFTFKISGLGLTSGAQVLTNQGDYWLAVDGQYIVKYNLDISTSMDPLTNILAREISINLDQINQPINIAFPQNCLDASLVTPEP